MEVEFARFYWYSYVALSFDDGRGSVKLVTSVGFIPVGLYCDTYNSNYSAPKNDVFFTVIFHMSRASGLPGRKRNRKERQ